MNFVLEIFSFSKSFVSGHYVQFGNDNDEDDDDAVAVAVLSCFEHCFRASFDVRWVFTKGNCKVFKNIFAKLNRHIS